MPASVIAAILERPARSLPDSAPPVLDRVLRRCLRGGPRGRRQSARDLKAALDLEATRGEATAREAPGGTRVWAAPAPRALGDFLSPPTSALAVLAQNFQKPREKSLRMGAGRRMPRKTRAATSKPIFAPSFKAIGKSLLNFIKPKSSSFMPALVTGISAATVAIRDLPGVRQHPERHRFATHLQTPSQPATAPSAARLPGIRKPESSDRCRTAC